ncbi:MAG: sigma-70 family RNA polymerase sigma factor [Actinomycetia bacterium]|nr:sigma-70 family RNA polymerase sigma factor [Actinomycetes bacterium]
MAAQREDVLSKLFRDNVAHVRGFARTLVLDDDVEDIVAATFDTAWTRLDDVPSSSQLAWLFGVARNHILNHTRAERRRAALIDDLVAFRPAEESGLHEDELDPVNKTALLQAMRLLTESEREILQLAAWYEMQPGEIATVLGISANSARVRLHRARNRLNAVTANINIVVAIRDE